MLNMVGISANSEGTPSPSLPFFPPFLLPYFPSFAVQHSDFPKASLQVPYTHRTAVTDSGLTAQCFSRFSFVFRYPFSYDIVRYRLN